MDRNKSIGVFDSGFGGLSVLCLLTEKLPEYNYVYLGDTARAPYGVRTQKEIYTFTKEAIAFLVEKDCDLIILACHTASSVALRKIQQEYLPKHYPFKRVLGVLIPTAEKAVMVTRSGIIGILATEGTVRSGAFVRELQKLKSDVSVLEQACPLLVPLIEEGDVNSLTVHITLQKYLKPLLEKRIDTLILGCTHYKLLEKAIRKIVGKKICIVSAEEAVTKGLVHYLKRHKEIERTLAQNGNITFYSSGRTEKFNSLGSIFFGKRVLAQKAILH